MATSDIARVQPPEDGSSLARANTARAGEGPPRAAPARPSLADKAAAPVIVKVAPPVSVRLAQLCWILSLVTGAAAVVYLFVIRTTQLPVIADAVKAVDGTRADATYAQAAEIMYWVAFGCLVVVLLLQVTMLVSFNNRRPNMRWWHLGTIVVLAAVGLAIYQLVAVGDRGLPLSRILALQLLLSLLALLLSVLPPALKWSARRHDVRRGTVGSSQPDL